MTLYRITSVHWSGRKGEKREEFVWSGKGKRREEFVVADNIKQVIEYSKLDLLDQELEVEGITKEVPVTKILCNP